MRSLNDDEEPVVDDASKTTLEKKSTRTDDDETHAMREQGGGNAVSATLMALIGWCAVAETTGVLEPIFVDAENDTLNKKTPYQVTKTRTKKKKD